MVGLRGAPRRRSLRAALVQVEVAGVDAETVEQVAPELLVVTRLGRRPIFRPPLLNVGKPPELELDEVMANRSAVDGGGHGK